MPGISSKQKLEARARIELAYKGFADLSLTTWVPRRSEPAQYSEIRAPSTSELPANYMPRPVNVCSKCTASARAPARPEPWSTGGALAIESNCSLPRAR